MVCGHNYWIWDLSKHKSNVNLLNLEQDISTTLAGTKPLFKLDIVEYVFCLAFVFTSIWKFNDIYWHIVLFALSYRLTYQMSTLHIKIVHPTKVSTTKQVAGNVWSWQFKWLTHSAWIRSFGVQVPLGIFSVSKHLNKFFNQTWILLPVQHSQIYEFRHALLYIWKLVRLSRLCCLCSS